MEFLDINLQFAELLQHHGVVVDVDDEYITTDLPDNVKFRAKSVYYKNENGLINSQLDVEALTDKGEVIQDACGDLGDTIGNAVTNNFQNFCASTLHPLLAALGCLDPHTYEQITIEDWEINGKIWKAYIGNVCPKLVADRDRVTLPANQFFECVEHAIYQQPLTNRLHWFRGYYCQSGNEIIIREFLMDNEVLDGDIVFNSLPITPKITFASCRIFIVLRDEQA